MLGATLGWVLAQIQSESHSHGRSLVLILDPLTQMAHTTLATTSLALLRVVNRMASGVDGPASSVASGRYPFHSSTSWLTVELGAPPMSVP